MSEAYIKKHFDAIKGYAGVIENRLDDSDCTMESVLADNAEMLRLARQHGAAYILLEDAYEVDTAFAE